MNDDEVARERRARQQRDRERQRATRPQRRPEPRQMSRPASPGGGALAKPREHHEGLFAWIARSVRALPAGALAVLLGFVREVGSVLRSVASPATKRLHADTGPIRVKAKAQAKRGASKAPAKAIPAGAAPRWEPAHGGVVRTRADERRSSVRRRRMRAAALCVGLCLLVIAWRTIPRAGIFDIHHVEIVGASSVSDLDVRRRIDPQLRGATIYDVDTGAIDRAVARFPFVRSVSVDRHFPSGLTIRVTEHRPLALGFDRGSKSWWLIAPSGRILAKARLHDWQGRVPIVRLETRGLHPGDQLASEPAIALLIAQSNDSTLAIASIDVRRYAVTAQLRDGMDIRFGRPEQLRTKIAVAQRMLAIMRMKHQQWKYLDVSVPGRVVPCEIDAACATLPAPDDPALAKAATARALAAAHAAGAATNASAAPASTVQTPADPATSADDSTVAETGAQQGPDAGPNAGNKPTKADAFDAATQDANATTQQ